MSKLKDLLKDKKIAIPLVVAFVAVAGFFAIQAVRANSDYICTIYEDKDGPCTDGTWSDFVVDPNSVVVNGCVTMQDEIHVYTGRKAIQKKIEYFANSRIGCVAGGTHRSISGLTNRYYHETTGRGWTRYQVCQIEERVTKRYEHCGTSSSSTPTSTATTTAEPTVTVVTVTSTTTLGTTTSTSTATTTEDLNRRRARIEARISANPRLVRSGSISVVEWATVEALPGSCTVTGVDKSGAMVGTPWIGGGGEENTPPLTEDTTYTLSCTDAVDGNPMTESVIIRVAPVPSEN